jgi:hypothetical protein
LSVWWPDVAATSPRDKSKDFNSVVLLVIRSIWLERNARVFNGAISMAIAVANGIHEE